MQHDVIVVWTWIWIIISQFPLWDFFECNPAEGDGDIKIPRKTLNSLCGISSNATENFTEKESGFENFDISQFPLWDFFECNLRW